MLFAGILLFRGLVAELPKFGGLIVDVVEEAVTVLCAAGRKFACVGKGKEGELLAGEDGAPSNGDGDGRGLAGDIEGVGGASSSTSGAGVTLGEPGGVSSLLLSLV